MTDRQDTTKGFFCECEVYHPFDVYVFAHMKDRLTHTCKNCGRKHTIQYGKATLVEEAA